MLYVDFNEIRKNLVLHVQKYLRMDYKNHRKWNFNYYLLLKKNVYSHHIGPDLNACKCCIVCNSLMAFHFSFYFFSTRFVFLFNRTLKINLITRFAIHLGFPPEGNDLERHAEIGPHLKNDSGCTTQSIIFFSSNSTSKSSFIHWYLYPEKSVDFDNYWRIFRSTSFIIRPCIGIWKIPSFLQLPPLMQKKRKKKSRLAYKNFTIEKLGKKKWLSHFLWSTIYTGIEPLTHLYRGYFS